MEHSLVQVVDFMENIESVEPTPAKPEPKKKEKKARQRRRTTLRKKTRRSPRRKALLSWQPRL